jgi:hypothetical protein
MWKHPIPRDRLRTYRLGDRNAANAARPGNYRTTREKR